uniref:Uncharacterized protein n=1 Tax=Arundo donax TaxID=35708 RepID=A0A0A8YTK9_ARUDO
MVTRQTAQVDAEHAVCHLRLAVGLWPEGGAEAKLDSGHREELRPKRAGEDRVTVAHDRAWQTVETHDVVEERLGDRQCCVWMAEGNEVRHLGEAIHDGQYHGFATDLGKPFDEVHGDVGPN